MTPGLRIEPVGSRSTRRRFADVARRIYPADSLWVRPLNAVVLDYLDTHRNPFYRDGAGQAFLAVRDEGDDARIRVHGLQRDTGQRGKAAGCRGRCLRQ